MHSLTALGIVALSHSIGWGIRGNVGHEYGAMIPGALSALALCIALPWPFLRERVALVGFAMLGVIGFLWALVGGAAVVVWLLGHRR